MPEFKLYFEFLCAFVPPEPFDQHPDRCWVVLPDLRSASKQHVPVFLYDRENRVHDEVLLHEGLTPKEGGVKSPKKKIPPDSRNMLPFETVEVEIRPDGEVMPADQFALDTTSSLGALLRIFRAGVKMEKFDEDLLTGAGGGKVVGRLLLRQGTLAIGQETEDIFGVYDASQKESKLLYKQKMAQQVVLTLGFVKFVDLVFRTLGENDGARHLRLKPTNGSEVKVTLRNCEEERMWDENLPPYKDQFDSEINLFFPLSSAYKEGTPPPRIVLRPITHSPGGTCAPKAFDGWGKKEGDQQ